MLVRIDPKARSAPVKKYEVKKMQQKRLTAVLEEMKKSKIPQLIITDPATIFYLTNHWILPGERLLALVISTYGTKKMVISKLFPIEENLGVDLIYYDDVDDPIKIVEQYVDKDQKIGVDKNWPAHFLLRLMETIPYENFVNGSAVTDSVRAHKDSKELDLMRSVSKDNDQAVEQLSQLISKGLSEKEMAVELAKIYKNLGNSGFSFEPIIAYGANTADPHHITDDSTVKPGDSVTLDIGGVKNSYCSDMTRTFFYKKVSPRGQEIYEIVLEANKRAIEKVKPGVRFCEIDAAARDYITEKGYGDYFLHRTGHFIGIECHETGDVSATNTSLVEPGMVFSIEPGIYYPQEKVGVRIEDLVIATKTGVENLNHFSKDLQIIQ